MSTSRITSEEGGARRWRQAGVPGANGRATFAYSKKLKSIALFRWLHEKIVNIARNFKWILFLNKIFHSFEQVISFNIEDNLNSIKTEQSFFFALYRGWNTTEGSERFKLYVEHWAYSGWNICEMQK